MIIRNKLQAQALEDLEEYLEGEVRINPHFFDDVSRMKTIIIPQPILDVLVMTEVFKSNTVLSKSMLTRLLASLSSWKKLHGFISIKASEKAARERQEHENKSRRIGTH